MSPKNTEDMKKEIKKLVADVIEIPESELTETARFAEDLGVDSMMALEVIASIEKKYKVIVPEEKLPTIRSLQDVYNVLSGLIK